LDTRVPLGARPAAGIAGLFIGEHGRSPAAHVAALYYSLGRREGLNTTQTAEYPLMGSPADSPSASIQSLR
jgi:hypothetical protein